jgi:phytoene synthase
VDEVVPEAEWQGGLTPEAVARARASLASWRDEVAAVYTGTPTTSQGLSLQPAAREFGLPRAQFESLIDGVEMDLARSTYATFDDLVEYCRRVASTVGLICVEIFGYRDPRARDYAVSLGLALQLTNIVRDVAADLRMGRVYLPADEMARFGVTADDLRRGIVTEPVRALLRHQCERARAYYRQASSQLPPSDARSLVAAEIMGGIYFGILERIERANYDVFTARVRVPRQERAVLALRIWLRALVGLTPDPRRAAASR